MNLRAKSAVVTMSNTQGEYTITANVNVDTQVTSIDNGVVQYAGGTQLASFTAWGYNSLNVSYNNIKQEERIAIMAAIDNFVQGCKDYFAGVTIDGFCTESKTTEAEDEEQQQEEPETDSKEEQEPEEPKAEEAEHEAEIEEEEPTEEEELTEEEEPTNNE